MIRLSVWPFPSPANLSFQGSPSFQYATKLSVSEQKLCIPSWPVPALPASIALLYSLSLDFSSQAGNHFPFSPFPIVIGFSCPANSLSLFPLPGETVCPTVMAFVSHHRFLSGFCNSLLLTSLPPSLSSTKHPFVATRMISLIPNLIVPLSEVGHLKVAQRVNRGRIFLLEAKSCQENFTR